MNLLQCLRIQGIQKNKGSRAYQILHIVFLENQLYNSLFFWRYRLNCSLGNTKKNNKKTGEIRRLFFTLCILAISFCFQGNFNFFNTVFIYFQGYKCKITGYNIFIHLGKFSCNFKYEARQENHCHHGSYQKY